VFANERLFRKPGRRLPLSQYADEPRAAAEFRGGGAGRRGRGSGRAHQLQQRAARRDHAVQRRQIRAHRLRPQLPADSTPHPENRAADLGAVRISLLQQGASLARRGPG